MFSSIAPSMQIVFDVPFDSYREALKDTFWKTMDYINANYEKDGGFAFWFEHDMLPTAPKWVDLLEDEWRRHPGVFVMGVFFPKKYFTKTKKFVPEHINGGACYLKYISELVPMKYRDVSDRGAFDVILFKYAKLTKLYHISKAFKFSHMYSLLSNIENSKNIILHGYRQDKNSFIDKAIDLMESPESRMGEKIFLSCMQKKNKICCDLMTKTGLLTNCPVHEKNTVFANCKNNILWYLMRAYYFLLRKKTPSVV